MGRPLGSSTPGQVRIWKYVDKRTPDECWEWQGSFATTGYGQMNVGGGKIQRVHRLMCLLHHGESDLNALHKCDNHKCCNPHHLYWGTASNIMQDARERARGIGKQRLTREQADEIRNSTARVKDLCEQYGISRWQVTNIRSGRQWAPLKTH